MATPPPAAPRSATTAVPGPDGLPVAVPLRAGRGPAMVLVHAAGMHGRVWEPLVEQLQSAFSCVAPDLRGHGDSGISAGEDFDWRGFARDVLAVVDSLGLEDPVGVGHSCGATALLLAEEARPGTFAALYCFEPVIVPADPPLGRDPDSWLAGVARGRRASFASHGEAMGHYAEREPLASLDDRALRAYVEHGLGERGDGTVCLKCRPEHEAAVYEMATAHDCFGRLDRVRCPVHVSRGCRSDAFDDRRLEAVARRLRAVSSEELTGLGHLGPLEDPRAVADSITRHLHGRACGGG